MKKTKLIILMIILTSSLIGCQKKADVTTTVAPQIIYKDRIIYKDSIITEKDNIDLKYLVELSKQVEILGENAPDEARMEYGHGQQAQKGFHENYATDIQYVKYLIQDAKANNLTPK